jgi:CubicO group peptidase (beta-lactamase class C family)
MIKKFFYLCCIAALLSTALLSCASTASPAAQAPIVSASITTIVDKLRQTIPEQMQKENIPGLAIAIVDDQGILWEQGFGYTDWDNQIPVTPSTLFSIQSMSKSFTATAAMFAAQEGLVDLDAAITSYLPNFHVNSIFEEHPEQKMTLRMLLSHTAGFPHDTSYGANYDRPADYSFEKHIASISDTWLMFPVGTRYNYSNEGIDLAGYILQVRSGMPFIQYVQQKVLNPLGMNDSTLDINRVRATATRAIGHTGAPLRPPVDFLLIPSGGVWTSAEDMARYVQFHINSGAIDGKRLLREDLAATMYTPPNYPASFADYALGITVSTRNGATIMEHGGGGFGFVDDMSWYPELKLGVVVLSNAHQSVSYPFNLGLNVLDSIIAGNIPLYRTRYISATHSSPAYPAKIKGDVVSDDALRTLIQSKTLPEDAAALQRRNSYAGTYIISSWGFPSDTFELKDSNGKLAWSYQGGLSQYSNTSSLTEVEPGLFFSENGSLFNLRGPVPMLDNIPLVKTDPQALPFKIALFAVCGLLFLTTLFFWPARALIRKIRRRTTPDDNINIRPPRNSWLIWTGGSAILASLFSLFCLALVALVPNLVYFPWPLPFADLLWWQSALLDLPFASLVLAVGIALVAVLSMRSHAWTRGIRGYYIAVGLVLLAFNLTILP